MDQLIPYEPGTFLEPGSDLSDPNCLSFYCERLLGRLPGSPEEFELWLRNRSELESALDQAGTIRYIRMTLATGDEEASKSYRRFIEEVIPRFEAWCAKLDRRALDIRKRAAHSPERHSVFFRRVENRVELYRPENIPLFTRDAVLCQEYLKICGAVTVRFRGEERTPQHMERFLIERDRPVREAAWRAVAERRERDAGRLEDLFDRMLETRQSAARNAGFANFRDYRFRFLERFDYGPRECSAYHEAVERRVVPLLKRIVRERKEALGVSSYRPWDERVDPVGGPLRPFESISRLVCGVERMFVRIDPTLAEWFRRIRSLGLLDLDSRKGKAPGGYQSTLAEARLPYIFMNAAGLDRDLRILLHESGHAFHVLASAPLPLKNDREPPVEFCEVASMSMELFGNACLDEFYSAEDARRSQKRHLEEIVRLLSWVAVVDAFQQWIYTRPGHGKNERRRAWSAICRRLGGDPADWSGLEHYFETLWHKQIHVFQYPFYYIEYAIAQLGALMFWKGYRRDPEKTLLRYRNSLARGGTLTLPELFGEAGLEFDFSERAVSPLVSMIETELARLDGKTGREPHHGESVSSVSGKIRRPEETGRT